MPDSISITLDNGQFNLLVTALGYAAASVGKGDPYAGYPDEFSRLRDEIQAQTGGPAGESARARLAARAA